MKIKDGNRIIAKYMNVAPIKISKDLYGLSALPWVSVTAETPEKVMDQIAEKLRYDSDWNYLIPVIKKIGDDVGDELVIRAETCYWNNFGECSPQIDFAGYNYPLSEGIWKAVVKRIQLINR